MSNDWIQFAAVFVLAFFTLTMVNYFPQTYLQYEEFITTFSPNGTPVTIKLFSIDEATFQKNLLELSRGALDMLCKLDILNCTETVFRSPGQGYEDDKTLPKLSFKCLML